MTPFSYMNENYCIWKGNWVILFSQVWHEYESNSQLCLSNIGCNGIPCHFRLDELGGTKKLMFLTH
jgi:hypothetical protein